METNFGSFTSRLEETVIHFFSPTGLLTAVILIIMSVALFSGSGVERRTVDSPSAEFHQAAGSPLLGKIK